MQTIRLELPNHVFANMPFVGRGVYSAEQLAQVRKSDPLPPSVIEITRTADFLKWRHCDETFTVALSDIAGAHVRFSTFMGSPYLVFSLHIKSENGCRVLMTCGLGADLRDKTELGLEGWFRDFADTIAPLMPGGVAVDLTRPLKS